MPYEAHPTPDAKQTQFQILCQMIATHGDSDECLLWPFKTRGSGYGQVWYEGRLWVVSRLAWTIVNGPIGDGLLLMHSCNNPPCFNLRHLSPGTTFDNAIDRNNKGRNWGGFNWNRHAPKVKVAKPLLECGNLRSSTLQSIEAVAELIRLHGDSDECLIWPFKKYTSGKHHYGIVTYQRTEWRVHRLAWKITNGRIYRDLQILHACDNPPCFNPKHLSQGTQADNLRDMDSKGRRRTNGRPGIKRGPNPLLQGENCGNSKLTDQQVLEIRKRWRIGETQTSIAKVYNVTQGLVGHIVHRKIWKHLQEEKDSTPLLQEANI